MRKMIIGLGLIFFGVVFLLKNLGVLEQSSWEELAGFWPLILIVLGVGMVTRRTVFGRLITFLVFLLSASFALVLSILVQ